MLAETGEIEVELVKSGSFHGGVLGDILRTEVDGVHVVYDMRDQGTCIDADVEWASVYFKRSFHPGHHPQHVLPFGLNYSVYGPKDWRFRRAWWALRTLNRSNHRDVLARVGRLLGVPANGGRWSSKLTAFEQPPSVEGTGVLLLTRLWRNDPSLSQQRIDQVRMLRAAFGDRFVGGVARSPIAETMCPDLIVDEAMSRKGAYLERMKGSAVCVATAGLQQSIGWRLAEYLAASRAVVSEAPAFEVPDLLDGTHYASFGSPDELAAVVESLLADDEKRARMRLANERYYRDAVRPDAAIARTLRLVHLGA